LEIIAVASRTSGRLSGVDTQHLDHRVADQHRVVGGNQHRRIGGALVVRVDVFSENSIGSVIAVCWKAV
jgi:hypothetical protein